MGVINYFGATRYGYLAYGRSLVFDVPYDISIDMDIRDIFLYAGIDIYRLFPTVITHIESRKIGGATIHSKKPVTQVLKTYADVEIINRSTKTFATVINSERAEDLIYVD